MTLVKRTPSNYEPPSADVHNGVICEFVDQGMTPNPFSIDKTTGKPELVHQGKYIIQVEERNSEGLRAGMRKELHVYFPMKLGKNKKFPSKFDKISAAVLGRAFTRDEIKSGVDAKSFVGKSLRITVKHKENMDGDVSAKAVDFMTPKVNLQPEDYTPLAQRGDNKSEDVPF